MSPCLRRVPGLGSRSGVCHVWDVVGFGWTLHKMDGTIKVRPEDGGVRVRGFAPGSALFFHSASSQNLCVAVPESRRPDFLYCFPPPSFLFLFAKILFERRKKSTWGGGYMRRSDGTHTRTRKKSVYRQTHIWDGIKTGILEELLKNIYPYPNTAWIRSKFAMLCCLIAWWGCVEVVWHCAVTVFYKS